LFDVNVNGIEVRSIFRCGAIIPNKFKSFWELRTVKRWRNTVVNKVQPQPKTNFSYLFYMRRLWGKSWQLWMMRMTSSISDNRLTVTGLGRDPGPGPLQPSNGAHRRLHLFTVKNNKQ
jgi:hypothetical protein